LGKQILFYLYLHITLDRPDEVALARHSATLAAYMRQYAAPGGDSMGVLLWLLMMKSTDAQIYDPLAGIAALADPSRTLTVLKWLRAARTTSWPSRIALMDILTDRVLQREFAVVELDYEAGG
jgi:hypothetical protein